MMELKVFLCGQHYSMIAVVFLFLHLSNLANGLQCYSCQKFTCDEQMEGRCEEMKYLSSATNQTRLLTQTWRSSPDCPFSAAETPDSRDFRDLNSSSAHKYIQNCPQDSTHCGSYVIRITAAIARIRNESETLYPILIPQNYHYSSILVFGCVRKSMEIQNSTLPTKDNNVTNKSHHDHDDHHTTTTTTNDQCSLKNFGHSKNQTTSYGNQVTINMTAEYTKCNECDHQNLCNYKYPNDHSSASTDDDHQTNNADKNDATSSQHQPPSSPPGSGSGSGSSQHLHGPTSWLCLLLISLLAFVVSFLTVSTI